MKTHTVYIEMPCSERLPEVGEVLDIIDNRKQTIPHVKFEGDGFYDNTFDRFYTIEQTFVWLEKREEQIVMSKEELANIIVELINDCEIPIPFEELMNSDKTHLTKNQYGLVLLKNLCIEIKEKLCKS